MAEDNYPMGAANDPNAPYNEKIPNPCEFEADVECLLKGRGKYETTTYMGGYVDDEGFYETEVYNGIERKCDLIKNQNYTPLELLAQYREMLEEKLEYERFKEYSRNKTSIIRELRLKIESCNIWTKEEFEDA